MTTERPASQDAADMTALAEGDEQALNRLMDIWTQPLLAYLARLAGNQATARDLAQETFVRVYRHRFNFKAGSRFSTWLFTIATNLARNHLRWHSRRPEVPLPKENLDSLPGHATSQTPENQAMAREQLAAVEAAIFELPRDMQEALLLATWHDMSQAEIAKVQNTSEKAVELRIYRARKLLREKLSGWFQ